MSQNIVGLILAGGLARRLGGRDKALLTLAGEPLLARAIARLRPQCDALVLNANGDAARFAAFGLPVAPDTVEGHAGPLAGILAGLDWIAGHAPGALLLTAPVDGPFLPPDLARRLQQALGEYGAAIACAASAGRRHGVYGLWPAALREPLRHAITVDGLRRVEDWLALHRCAVVDWPAEPVDPFFNINTPDDLAAAAQLAAPAA